MWADKYVRTEIHSTMKKQWNDWKRLLCAFVACVLSGCFSTVKVIENEHNIHLSGRWNAADSRKTGEEIADKLLSQSWLETYLQTHDQKRPVVICGGVLNRTHEHIDAETFRQDIERAMINSGKIRVVQSSDNRAQIRTERADQQKFASAHTQKKLAHETGADFMLQGVMSSIVDQNKNEKIVYYQIDLTLTNLESNEIVWSGTNKITKKITY